MTKKPEIRRIGKRPEQAEIIFQVCSQMSLIKLALEKGCDDVTDDEYNGIATTLVDIQNKLTPIAEFCMDVDDYLYGPAAYSHENLSRGSRI